MKPIYRGKVIDLYLEEIVLPNRHTMTLEIIRHSGAAAVVPLLPDGKVVLIRQYRHAAGGFIYEIPAGRLHPGEDPEACARRELEEEAGYRAGRLERLVSIYTTPGFTDERIHIFLATDLQKGTQRLEADEVLESVTFPLEETVRMIREGKIVDGKTVVGLQTAYLKLSGSR